MAEGRSGNDRNSVHNSYLHAYGITSLEEEESAGWMRFTPQEEEEFETMAKRSDIRDLIYKSIAPDIKSRKGDCIGDVKKAVASLLFGGAHKHLPGGQRLRGDINVLLFGDPGTAKSQFLKFCHNVSNISVYTSGKGSSAAGLTAAIVKEKNGSYCLEGGAMVLADNGVVCIDEFDKMRPDDRVAIHEAMEQGTISIAKAGLTTMLNTRCSVMAAANPIDGSIRDTVSTDAQMDFSGTILSRFDLIFLIRDVRDLERDRTLAVHVMKIHQGQHQNEDSAPIKIGGLKK